MCMTWMCVNTLKVRNFGYTSEGSERGSYSRETAVRRTDSKESQRWGYVTDSEILVW